MHDTDQILTQARTVLHGNLVQNEEYFYTCPSVGTYQHQWLWDSCFHAIVWSYFDPGIAQRELLCVIKKQFDNGLLPHMAYWKKATGLIPRLGDWLFRRLWPEKDRSCITQPPLIAQAVASVYGKTQDKAFLENMLGPLQKFYDWLHNERNERISGDGLISIVHPWESGMDLLPLWDGIHKINHFFTLRTGLWLSKLIKEYNKINWMIEHIKKLNRFLVKDVSFNVIYILNLQVLANLCQELGDEVKRKLYLNRAEEAQRSLIEKCWDEETGFFYSITSMEDEFLTELTISGLFPVTLDIDKKKIDRLIREHLVNEGEFWLPYPIPSVARSSPKFNPKGSTMVLWRGPTWVCTNWYIVKGLQHQGYTEYADQIIHKMCEMIELSGFREQYNPLTGEGYGAKNFSWTTLIVDLL